MIKVSDDLKTARARLAVPGVWGQAPHDDLDFPCKLCLALATNRLAHEFECDRLLKRVLDTNLSGMFSWNDAPGRTLEEVLAVYDKAIAIAEKEEADEART